MNILKKNIPIRSTKATSNPFLSIQNELNRAMGDFYNWFEPFNFPVERFENLSLAPAVDIIEDSEHFKVEAEMPGMDEENVKVSIDNGILSIHGEKTISKKNNNKNYMSREISYGCYDRNISLPDSVDVNKAKATFKKGMLWVELPKRHEHAKESRVIEVEKI